MIPQHHELKSTPIISGLDARRFIENMENIKPLSEYVRKRIQDNYDYMVSISDGTL